jgi:Amt family ammonium transporter
VDRNRRLLLALAVGGLALAVPVAAFAGEGATDTDKLWILVSAALIFVMQTGFLLLESGLVRPQNGPITALKGVVDWTVTSVIWLVFGYGLAFGATFHGIVGTSLWMGVGFDPPVGNGLGWLYFLFQLGFVGTSVTIVSGAMAERVGFHTYVICSIVNAGLIYPLVCHWCWGNGFIAQPAWLADLGFRDFAGSTVVHSVGGWISLVAIWMLGPRVGRFDADGKPRPIATNSIPLAAAGAFLLWFGWWGFNGGSTLVAGESAAKVIANTNVAGATGGLVAWLYGRYAPPHRDVQNKFLGGALAGLVAITACSNVVSPVGALVVGVLAGFVHNLAYEALYRFELDDPVGAVPVHLAGGILGTLCIALFGQQDLLPLPRVQQLGVQVLGVAVVGAFTVAVTVATLAVVKRTLGLRVSAREELAGVTLEPYVEAPPELPPDEAELRRRMGG